MRRVKLGRLAAAVMLLGLAACGDGDSQASSDDSPGLLATNAKPEDAVQTLFTQVAERGSFAPNADRPGWYRLHLTGVMPATVAFSSRPERRVSEVPMADSLEAIGFADSNPPNAAIAVRQPDGSESIVVGELTRPLYSAEEGTLDYDVMILEEGDGSLAVYNDRNEPSLPESFGACSLLIDDCSDQVGLCIAQSYVGKAYYSETGPANDAYSALRMGSCWSWRSGCHIWNCYASQATPEEFQTAADQECQDSYGADAVFAEVDSPGLLSNGIWYVERPTSPGP